MPVPPDDRLGPDEYQVAPPVAPQPPRDYPEQLVSCAQPGLPPGWASQHRQLVAQEHVLRDEVAPGANGAPERGQEEGEELGHDHSMPARDAGLLPV